MATPGMSDRPAVLLTGVGKRYDIVSAFAQHTTVVAADPNPLAPAQYAAHHRAAVPRIDPSGNVDPTPAARSFDVDSHAPQTTITSGPSGKTHNRRPTFKFRSSESASTFRCALDAGPYRTCSSPHKTAKLGLGPHVFHVRARDRAGNLDATPASRSFDVVP